MKKKYLTHKILFFAALGAIFSCYAYSTTEVKSFTKENECTHIDFLNNTYKTIPISTEKKINEGFLFSSTDKIYSHTKKTCITLNNISGERQEITIRLDNPRIRHVEIIKSKNNNSEAPVVSGLDYPLENWKTIGSEIMFTLSMEPSSVQQVDLRLGSIFPYNSQIQISSSEAAIDTLFWQQMAIGLLSGLIFSMVFYSASIGINSKDKTYLFLFGSTVFVTLLQLNDIGALYQLWPDSIYWNNVSSGIFAVISTLCGVELARSYLITKASTPRADNFLKGISLYLLLVAMPLPLLENDNLFMALFALPAVIVILPSLFITSVIRIRQKYTPAKLYFIALTMPFIAGLLIFLMYLGAIPSSPMAKVFPLTGTAFQLILFAIALGERINWLKEQQKIFYQDELLSKTETNAKKNFLAHISHELRTPLAGIIGLADLAKKNTLYSTNKALIDGINESAKHLLDTTNTLLDHARLDAGKWAITKETFSPASLIKESIANSREKLQKKNIIISYNIDKTSKELVYADETIIRKILEIIIENSANTINDGSILVNFETFNNDSESLFMRFDIIDTGSGFPEDHKTRIFEIFELVDTSTTREQQGPGLSLSLCKKFCNLLGGEIGYDSNPQHGTAFWFVIPCSLPPENSAPIIAEAPSIRNASGEDSNFLKRVLVAEDDETLQLIISSQLEKIGKVHTVFPNGKPLVEEYIKNYQDIGMVLLDWNMPIYNASETIARIRQFEESRQLPPVNVAVLSAHDKYNVANMNLPSDIRLLQKPVSTDDLVQLLTSNCLL
jgi:signal transduction histidine kinase/CheY-like chemotaxis protein